jgi:hypothetical protein
MTKAVSPLFAGEPNSKRFRIALDEIAGLPKQLLKQQNNGQAYSVEAMHGQPPLSELIMEAATTHLSDEVLYRSPKESYEKMMWEQEQMDHKRIFVNSTFDRNATSIVNEWQESRKDDKERERIESGYE